LLPENNDAVSQHYTSIFFSWVPTPSNAAETYQVIQGIEATGVHSAVTDKVNTKTDKIVE